MFSRALRYLEKRGCSTNTQSAAVAMRHCRLESAIHELAHALVARLPLEVQGSPNKLGEEVVHGVSNRVAIRIHNMRGWHADQNEEIALAVSMRVLNVLGIKYHYRVFVDDANWFTDRNHSKYIRLALRRPETNKHARRIVRYLNRINKRHPDNGRINVL